MANHDYEQTVHPARVLAASRLHSPTIKERPLSSTCIYLQGETKIRKKRKKTKKNSIYTTSHNEVASKSCTKMASNAAYYDPAMDSPRLCQDIFSILESQFLSGALKPSFPTVSTSGKVRILSIDGTSGDLAATSLLHLESALRRLSGDPSASLSHFFDLAVGSGSGSGALLASLIFANNLSAENASLLLSQIQLEKSKTQTRFGRLFKKESKVLNKVFGEATLKDASKPLLITCYDLNTGAPFVFSRADAVEADGFDFKIRDVCEAATCQRKAKKEVKSVNGETRIRVLDADVSSNPTAVGITHVMHNKQEFPFVNGLEDVFVLSIGGRGSCGSDAVSVAGACQADMVS